MTKETIEILARARTRGDARVAAETPSFDALNRIIGRQRAALTRAQRSGPDAVVLACRKAVREWNEVGWPDDWSRWQRALDDALPFGESVEVENLA